MAVGGEFFGPLGAHLRSALTDVPDADLAVAHRVLTAMITAMSMFEEELRGQAPVSAKDARRHRGRTVVPLASAGFLKLIPIGFVVWRACG
jgi:hypothetical protein